LHHCARALRDGGRQREDVSFANAEDEDVADGDTGAQREDLFNADGQRKLVGNAC
jgi:hypothetical protein